MFSFCIREVRVVDQWVFAGRDIFRNLSKLDNASIQFNVGRNLLLTERIPHALSWSVS